jgi:hypothetical protein
MQGPAIGKDVSTSAKQDTTQATLSTALALQVLSLIQARDVYFAVSQSCNGAGFVPIHPPSIGI